MKIKFFYHGSPKKIKGKFLLPNKPQDLEKKKENLRKAVYATNLKKSAIAMALICSKGVVSASIDIKKGKKAIVYEGWPKQKYVYLYTLPKKGFVKSKGISGQHVSSEPVCLIKTERIKVKNYLNLIRKATKKEIQEYLKKYRLR